MIKYEETLEPPTKVSRTGEQINGKGVIFAPTDGFCNGLNEFNWTLKSNNNKKFKLKVTFFNFLYFGVFSEIPKHPSLEQNVPV